MIKEVKMYTIICDNCGKDLCDGTEYSCWNDEGYVKDSANEVLECWVGKGIIKDMEESYARSLEKANLINTEPKTELVNGFLEEREKWLARFRELILSAP